MEYVEYKKKTIEMEKSFCDFFYCNMEYYKYLPKEQIILDIKNHMKELIDHCDWKYNLEKN